MVTSFYDFLDPLSQEPTIIAQAVNGTFVPVSQVGSTVGASIDPNIKLSYVEELSARLSISYRGIVGRVQAVDGASTASRSSIRRPCGRPSSGPIQGQTAESVQRMTPAISRFT
jgi:hypothetical protein